MLKALLIIVCVMLLASIVAAVLGAVLFAHWLAGGDAHDMEAEDYMGTAHAPSSPPAPPGASCAGGAIGPHPSGRAVTVQEVRA